MNGIYSTLTKQVPDTLTRAADWRDNAACLEADPDLFFPRGTDPTSLADQERATKICARCPVMEACRQWALDTRQEHGVWGGLTAKERHNLRRRQARAAASDDELQRLATGMLAEHGRPVGDHQAWYGPTSMRVKGVVTTAKRIAWIAAHGARPAAPLIVDCGYPACILPAHMRLQSKGDADRLTVEEVAEYQNSVYLARSVDVGDGHREWRSSEPVTVINVSYTARQLAWAATHGDRPVGVLQVTCGRKGCIAPGHLRDRGAAAA